MALDDKLAAMKVEIRAEIDRLQGILASLEGTSTIGNPRRGSGRKGSAATKANKGEKRTRRSFDELAASAKKAAEFIKTKGKDGAAASEFAHMIGNPQSAKKFFKQYGADLSVKTKGKKSATMYFVE